MRDEPKRWAKVLNCTLIIYHKGCWFILTAGRWSWKSKSAKECVSLDLALAAHYRGQI